ncbi:hypothetical protein N018_10250 [Pseudomonas syringae CC1557]|uniref:Uncharacterized protein n=1 Tax=Pseudomonas syringae CC1557 TaxID=1357279 RepID=W0N3C1_PSESX|nr:hypothetical protein N018_10250 [Pseudomonas syringae CC1557]
MDRCRDCGHLVFRLMYMQDFQALQGVAQRLHLTATEQSPRRKTATILVVAKQ